MNMLGAVFDGGLKLFVNRCAPQTWTTESNVVGSVLDHSCGPVRGLSSAFVEFEFCYGTGGHCLNGYVIFLSGNPRGS